MLSRHPHDDRTNAVHGRRQDCEDVSSYLYVGTAAPEGLDFSPVGAHAVRQSHASAAQESTDKVSQTCRPFQAPRPRPWHNVPVQVMGLAFLRHATSSQTPVPSAS